MKANSWPWSGMASMTPPLSRRPMSHRHRIRYRRGHRSRKRAPDIEGALRADEHDALSKATTRNIRQNFVLVFSYSTAAIPGGGPALSGHGSIALAHGSWSCDGTFQHQHQHQRRRQLNPPQPLHTPTPRPAKTPRSQRTCKDSVSGRCLVRAGAFVEAKIRHTQVTRSSAGIAGNVLHGLVGIVPSESPLGCLPCSAVSSAAWERPPERSPSGPFGLLPPALSVGRTGFSLWGTALMRRR